MKPVFVGYFAKQTSPRPPEMDASHVEEIASVSDCISSGPKDWVAAWKHNDYGFFDTEELALERVAAELRDTADLYAYDLYPVRYEEGLEWSIELRPPAATPPESDFEELGFDVVSRSTSSFFECSPLSCNGLASDIPTNACCLIEELDVARMIARDCESMGCEPGPYFVFGVWRRPRRSRGPDETGAS